MRNLFFGAAAAATLALAISAPVHSEDAPVSADQQLSALVDGYWGRLFALWPL